MSETLEQTTTQEQPEVQATPDAAKVIGDALWNLQSTPYQDVQTQPQSQEQQAANQPAAQPQNTPTPDGDGSEVLDEDEFYKRSYGMSAADFKAKWEELNKPQTQPQPQEVRWNYDDSKEDEIYNYIHQKRELSRLEKLEIADAAHAAEIIRANLQFKHKDLSAQEIDRLFNRQYAMPPQPQRGIDQEDAEYEAVLASWNAQVKEKQQDMIIDAKLAKPELLQFKNQIVQPQYQKPEVQQQGPNQEDLDRAEAGRKAYLSAIESSYQNFKGYNVTAKSGDAQLPISYNISQDELMATKTAIEDFNVDSFFGQRWFGENNVPRVNLIQEDLYLLQNKDKVLQKVANEAAAQMYEYMIKKQNNINLSGVNTTLSPSSPTQAEKPKPVSQQLGDALWGVNTQTN